MENRQIQVVFATPLRQSYSYTVPSGLDASLGVRVVAPFGRQKLTGFVISETKAITETAQVESAYVIKPIEKVLDIEPLFDESLLAIARWVAGMYFCSLGEALSAILPNAKQERAVV